jgi:hypothetical protein
MWDLPPENELMEELIKNQIRRYLLLQGTL